MYILTSVVTQPTQNSRNISIDYDAVLIVSLRALLVAPSGIPPCGTNPGYASVSLPSGGGIFTTQLEAYGVAAPGDGASLAPASS